jgi:hypothetical protein
MIILKKTKQINLTLSSCDDQSLAEALQHVADQVADGKMSGAESNSFFKFEYQVVNA